MLLWFAGTAVVTIWFVFRDPRFDYRLLVVGSIAPAVVDVWFGGARVLHSLAFSVGLLAVVMIATIGRRALRRTLLGLPLGTLLHLVYTGAWTDTSTFWWPFSGGFDDAQLPIVARGWWNVPLELAGLVIVVWIVRATGLTDPDRRRARLAHRPARLRCRREPAPAGCDSPCVIHWASMLILVRHGRTAANAAGQLQGRLDQPLDDLGERQALAVAAHVGPSTRSSRAHCSALAKPRRRSVEPVHVDERWIEIAYGKYEGMPHGDVPSEVWNYWRTDANFVPEGGESAAAVDVRVRARVRRVGRAHRRSGHRRRQPCVADEVGGRLGARRRLRRSRGGPICRTPPCAGSRCRPQGPVLFSFNERAPLTPMC